jgi:hypothetical protein
LLLSLGEDDASASRTGQIVPADEMRNSATDS